MPKRYLLVAGTFLLSMLLYVDRACISAAKTPICSDLSFSEKEFGWIMASFALGYALLQTPSGMLADRFGPRVVLTAVVSFWSLFTGLTAAARSLWSMIVVRFLFGAGEAGAFPGCARAFFSWLPMAERGIVQGINFSGSRLGAAFAFPAVSALMGAFGWHVTFVILGAVGFVWAAFWYRWFRNDPGEKAGITQVELAYILNERQQAAAGAGDAPALTAGTLFGSRNVVLAMGQYFCSNFTFYFCLFWLYPHLKKTYGLGDITTGFLAAVPLVCGAVGNWVSGALVDRIYRRGQWVLSRRLPAVIGFLLAAVGLVVSVYMDTAVASTIWLSVAIFGADMTLSPSWSFCIDVGRRNAGTVSGTMNMAGNLGAFLTGLAFPYLKAWFGSVLPFFFVGAVLNLMGGVLWLGMKPDKVLEEY